MRFLAICLLAALAGCSGATGGPPRVLEFQAQNDSGVTGTATLSSAGQDRTLVEIVVDPNGHANMPAHIHPGTCADPVPQPRYPLENVREGVSRTEVPASMTELQADEVSINVHRSNEEMQIIVACVDVS
jgi:hypothetical protein